ncbi:unnamed protein product [Thelazia callipaeda]|uniref:Uncharacterized protein n=1 Tax=Thelazia callipaeda TaxID=103827 RepID=A0A158RCD0_THECL|nr:unnamed protein product [Thelazia callipaeda]
MLTFFLPIFLSIVLISKTFSTSSSSLVSMGYTDNFELDRQLPSITCRQCIQLWRIIAKDARSTCALQSRTCTGNVCFMRQCKNCPVYQYMAGCLTLTEWQITDLAFSRQHSELLATRVGATLLCEDSINQTTCICNRKDKCNDIHARAPFSTYNAPLFGDIINFDAIISKIDPYYNDVVRSKHVLSYFTADNTAKCPFSYLTLVINCSALFISFLHALYIG